MTLGRRPVADPDLENVVVPDFDKPRVEAALARRTFDVVVHLAAAGVNPAQRDCAALSRINGVLPYELVDIAASRGAQAVIIAGSSAEYAYSGKRTILNEDAPLESSKIYGATKAAGGIMALAHGAARKIPVAILRIFNVYGHGEASYRLFPTLVEALNRKAKVPLSAGTQIRDFIYIDDVCAAFCEVLQKLAAGEMGSGAHNLATGSGCSVADFAKIVTRQIGAEEGLLDFGALPMRPDDVAYLVGDPSRLQQSTAWRPAWTIEEGVSAALEAYRAALSR